MDRLEGGGGAEGLGLQFLDLTDEALSGSEREQLCGILRPGCVPLPGAGQGVWRTPQPQPDSQDQEAGLLQFGEATAVIQSLAVTLPTPSARPTLSANTAPFIPGLSVSSHSIPIPIPAIPNGQNAQSIHINNFTANLNYPLALGGQESPAAYNPGLQLQQVVPPGYLYDGQGYQTGFPGQPYMYVAVSPSGHYPALQREATPPHPSRGPAVTFGSTPVVSINSRRSAEAEEGMSSGERVSAGHFGGQRQPSLSEHFNPPRQSCQSSQPAQSQPSQTSHCSQPHPAQSAQQAQAVQQAQPAQPAQPHPAQPAQPAQQSQAAQAAQPHPAQRVQPSVPYTGDATDEVESPHGAAVDVVPSRSPRIPDPAAMAPASAVTLSPLPTPLVQVNKGESLEVGSETRSPPNSAADSRLSNGNHIAKAENGQAALCAASPNAAPTKPVSSWASLFNKSSDGASDSGKPVAIIEPFTGGSELTEVGPGERASEQEMRLGTFLSSYTLKHGYTALLPRGLTNRSNWCFVNAIMQALLACPPFHNLMKSLCAINPPIKSQKSKTPMIDAVTEFISEFIVLDQDVAANKPPKKDKSRKKEDIVTGISLEPSFIFKMLLNLADDTFKVVDGRQEDAEEFLSCLLNGLSDEMLGLIKLAGVESVSEEEEVGEQQEGEDEDWMEVGARGRSCVTRRVAGTTQLQTPIQALALGMCRSFVKSEGGDNSANLQPFFTLQLDIQDKEIEDVSEALRKNFANEELNGFICSKTKKEIDATKILSLEELPPVLILHLKRFIYDGQTGAVQKIMKQIEFGVDLEVCKSILSAECRTTNKQRQYKVGIT